MRKLVIFKKLRVITSFKVSRKCEKKVAIIRYSLLFHVKSIDNYTNRYFSHTKYVS
jgi:hypothetical protein